MSSNLFKTTRFVIPPKSVAEAISLSNLNFTVEKRPLYLEGRPIPSHRAMVRADTGELLSVVGVDYEPVQAAEAFGMVQPLLDANLATIREVGYTNNGGRLFIEADLVFDRPLEVRKGDIVAQRVRFLNSHDGSTSLAAYYDMLRLVCLNGMTAGERSKLFSARHTVNVLRALDTAKVEFAQHRALLQSSVEEYRGFAARRLSQSNLVRYVRETLQAGAGNNPDIKVRNVDRIVELAETAPGATPGTLYGGLNAVTYWATHERGRNDNSRVNSLIFGQGGQLIARATEVARAYAPKLPAAQVAA